MCCDIIVVSQFLFCIFLIVDNYTKYNFLYCNSIGFYIVINLRLNLFPFCLFCVLFMHNSHGWPCIWMSYCCFCVVRLRVPIGCTTELNHLGYEFLQRLFDKYDEVSINTNCLICLNVPLDSKFLCGIFDHGYLVLRKILLPILGQRLCPVATWAQEPVLRLSLHAMGCRGLHDCPNDRRGLHL